MSLKILLIDDDHVGSYAIKKYIEDQGQYEITWMSRAIEGYNHLIQCDYDLLLLDINMPDLNGLDLLKQLRLNDKKMLVMLVSVRGRERDILTALNLGGDDYLVKPFSMVMLCAKINSIFRIKQLLKKDSIVLGDTSMDFSKRLLCKNERQVKLNSKEWSILKLLVQNEGHVFSRNQLLERIWGLDYSGSSRAVDTAIARLRKKLVKICSTWKIVSNRNIGYSFEYE